MNDNHAGARAPLARLAACAGILPEYLDVRGEPHVTSVETQRALLAAMGIPAATDAEAMASLAAHEARSWQRRLEPVAVFTEDEPTLAVAVTLPTKLAARELGWTLTRETGEVVRGTLVPERSAAMAEHRLGNARFTRYRFDLSAAGVALQPGYHRFELAKVAPSFGSGSDSRPAASVKPAKRVNSACRPRRTAAASSGPKSQKN